MEPGIDVQGWQSLPTDLLDCVAARLTKRDHKAVSLVCKHWKEAGRRQARKAAASDARNVQALLHSFPNLVELHLNGIQGALPEHAVHAAACHASLHSLHLNSSSAQPALLEALAAVGRLQNLFIKDVSTPAQGPLPQAQLQLTGWTSLRKLHIKDTGSQDMLNALLSSFDTLPHLTELSVTYRGKADQLGHDPDALRSNLARLPSMPELRNLRLDYSGLTRRRYIFPQPKLTSLALVNELQLPDGFFRGLRAHTALRALHLSSWDGPRPAVISNANVAAVLPRLGHLTSLSLAGCSALHMSCLNSLRIACTELQHLNIATLQRSGVTLTPPNSLTQLDISCDHGSAAVYRLPHGLRHVNISNTVLGNSFSQDLPALCPDLQYLDARGCKMMTGHHCGIHCLVKCRHLEVLLLDGSGVGCTAIAYLMLRCGDLRLAEDLGTDEPWSFEPWANDAVILVKQAMVTLMDRRFISFAVFVWAFDHMLFGLSCLHLVFWWLGVSLGHPLPVGRQYLSKGLVHSCLVALLPVPLCLCGVRSFGHLGVIVLKVAVPLFTGPRVLRVAEVCSHIGRVVSAFVFVARWLKSPAYRRLCNKPTASGIIPFAAALSCAGSVMLLQYCHLVLDADQVVPFLPGPVAALVMLMAIVGMLCIGMFGLYMLGLVCSLVCSLAFMRE